MRKKPTVAFILHPLSVSEFNENRFLYHPNEFLINWILRLLNNQRKRSFYMSLPPHVLFTAKDEEFMSKNIRILGIMCPVFPKEFIVSKDLSNEKLRKAVKLAKKKGADVVVLTGFTAIASNQGDFLKDDFKDIVITTGNALTAALCVDGIKKAADLLGINIHQESLAIIGASGDVGSACSRFFSENVNQLILCSRNLSVDSPIVSELKGEKAKVKIETNVQKAVAGARIILFCTSSYTFLANKEDFSPFSIIADASLPHNIPDDLVHREDIFAFDAGKAKFVPPPKKYAFKRMTNNGNAIVGCIAEGISIAASDKQILPSLGRGNIRPQEMQRILNCAGEAGFSLADFSFYNRKYSEKEMMNYKHQFSGV